MTKRHMLAYKPIAVLSVLLTATSVVTAVMVFGQTFPVLSISPNLTANCTTLIADPSEVAIGSDGQITFECNPDSAFTVTGGTVTAVPTFDVLTAGYDSLHIYKWDGVMITGACSTRTANAPLTSTSQVSLAPQEWAYCATFTGATTLDTFSVDWDVS